MAAITMFESAKRAIDNGNITSAAVISQFAQSSGYLNMLDWKDIVGAAYVYKKEGALPTGIGFRGINEAYNTSYGVLNPESEALRIIGTDLDVDTASVKMFGQSQRATEEALAIKAISQTLTTTFIKGDSASNPKAFDGLQVRIGTGTQLLDNGSTSGGDPLSLFNLDTLVAKVAGNRKALLMNRQMRLRITQAARNTAVGGFVTWSTDSFGRLVPAYNGIPIVEAYVDNDGVDPIAFDEAGAGGGSTATSIYCIGMGEGYVQGIQNGVLDARDLGEISSAPVYRTRIEWLISMIVPNGRAIARLRGISNAAVVA